MKFINPTLHGLLDYGTVLAFLALPGLAGFSATPALLAYALGGSHLLTTLVTDFRLALWRRLPFPLHGWLERVIGPALMVAPFLLGFRGEPLALYFFVGSGVAIVLVTFFTDYDAAS